MTTKSKHRDGSITVRARKPPNMLALVNRVYRKILNREKHEREVNSRLAVLEIQGEQLRQAVDTILNTALTDAAHIETIKTLTAHAERLLREKEQLMAAVTVEELQERLNESMPSPTASADQFIAAPLAAEPYAAALRDARPAYLSREADYYTDPSMGADAPIERSIVNVPAREAMSWEAARQRVASAIENRPAENGHVRPAPARRPAYELCGFVATHVPGIRCGVCEWEG
jgi:hypothetical protein